MSCSHVDRIRVVMAEIYALLGELAEETDACNLRCADEVAGFRTLMHRLPAFTHTRPFAHLKLLRGRDDR